MKKSEEYKKKMKEVKHQTIDDLEPLVKKSGERIINVAQEVLNDLISDLFNKSRKEKNNAS